MAKRSKRRPTRKDVQMGCMWGLISLFDFRQGRSTRRLLSDRIRECEQSVGAEHSSTKTTLQGSTEKSEDAVEVEAEENTMPMIDVVKPSVKELMEEEMINEQGLKNRLNDYETCLDQVDFKYGQHKKKNPKRKNRICNNSSDIDISELGIKKYSVPGNFEEVPAQKTANSLDLEMIMEELAKINQRSANYEKPDFNSDLETVTVVEEEIVSAIKLFIEQRVSSYDKHLGEEGKSCYSREFTDALQTLSKNKRVFLKLLKDPNSVLVKCIQNSDNARIEPGSFLSEEKPINLKSDEFISRKHRNFFRRKSTSLESDLSGRDKIGQSSSKIVILKPGPEVVRSPETGMDVRGVSFQSNYLDNKGNNMRNSSQFSFHEIKRKLRHAMGKEKQGISLDGLIVKPSSKHRNGNSGEKGVSGENFTWSSPNRNHFYTEKFTKSSTSFQKGEQAGKLKAKGSAMLDETCQYQKLGVSNIYIEAKKHLSEILNNEDENAESMTEQLHKSLGRILSFPDYNSSPCCSPGKHRDGIFITAHMRLSPRGIVTNGQLQENNNNYPSSSMPNLDSQHCISVSTFDDKVESLGMNVDVEVSDDQEGLENKSDIGGIINDEVSNSSSRVVEIEEMAESMLYEDNVCTISSESISNSISGDIQNVDFKEGENRENTTKILEDSSCRFKSDFVAEDQILSSPTVSPTQSPVSREVKISDCVHEKMERPSPISVLEPLFPDDDISPASTKSQLVEKDIPPLHIHFEEQSSASDQGICVRISLEDEESAFEYVEAVLLGSGLNWDEFLSRWLSSYEILDSSLFNEVELFSSRPHHDQKLLFDCANEALKEVCDRYFGCFSGLSNHKQNIRPVAKGMDLIHEVWREIEWHICEHQSPRCLEQLVERDMARSGKWMNLQSDLEVICFEMWETVFEDLVEDIVLSCVTIPQNSLVKCNQLVSF